ncbi:hypothetical protein P9209_18480 [Prescottella defluvii]|nr:hypothetical protein P9209_18480 [Prescottella defluvii]
MTREFGWIGSSDTRAASWLAPYPYPYDTPVGGWLADRYTHVLQILHPAYRWHDSDTDPSPVSWAQIAAASGTQLKPGVGFSEVGRLQGPDETVDGVFDTRPEASSIPAEWIDTVYGHLDDAHIGSVVGRVGTFVDVEIRGAARIRDTAGWEYVVLSTTREIDEHTFFSRTPNFWWPEDRSWCAATGVDEEDTLVVSTDLARLAAIHADPRLETQLHSR